MPHCPQSERVSQGSGKKRMLSNSCDPKCTPTCPDDYPPKNSPVTPLENPREPLSSSLRAVGSMSFPTILTGKSGFIVKCIVPGVLIAVLLSGCGKKVVRDGVPFELDKVFSGVFSTPQQDWKEKGIRLAKNGNYDEAIEAFKNYVLENPENFFGFNALAVCYKNIGDSSQAMKNYERALEFAQSNEDRAKILSNIGNLYSTAKKYQVALGFYKEAYSEFSQNPMYLILIARTFLFLDEYARARKVLAAAEEVHRGLDKYEKDDDRGLGYYLMAQSYVALSEEDKVFQYLEKALRLNPGKFVLKLNQDIADEQSLLYTIRDDSRLQKVLQRHSRRLSPQDLNGRTVRGCAQLANCS